MEESFIKKATGLFESIISDDRWHLELVNYAYSTFQQPTEGLYSQLVEIGHSHALNVDLKELVNSILRMPL